MKRIIILSIFLLSAIASFAQSANVPKTLYASGTDTYTITETSPSTYSVLEKFVVQFTNANTGAATLNRAGLGPKHIKKAGNVALVVGDIKAGQQYTLSYDGTNYQILGGPNAFTLTTTGSSGAATFSNNVLNIPQYSGGGGSGGGGFKAQSTAPSDTTTSWVDIGNPFADAFPIRRYVSGEWEPINAAMDYYDPIGEIISKGRPFTILGGGQSNFNRAAFTDYINTTLGDTTKNNLITLWNADAEIWTVPNPQYAPSGGTTDNWAWGAPYVGESAIQRFARKIVKETGRTVRIVAWRVSGTPLACWEPTGTPTPACWNQLIDKAVDSGVSYFDMIWFQQAEGGLADGSYTSAYATYQESLYQGIMNGLRSQSYCDKNTLFLMPSGATGSVIYQNGSLPANASEAAIRSLNYSGNPFNAHIKTNPIRSVQVAVAANKTTSSTSVNLTTVTAGVSITVPTGLVDNFSGTSGVTVISRSTNEYFTGTGTYNSGTGALVITAGYWTGEFRVFGTGTYTDWDVIGNDPLHNTVRENIEIGESAFNAYKSIIGGQNRSVPTTYQTRDATGSKGGLVTDQRIVTPPSNQTIQYFSTNSTTTGIALQNQYAAGTGSPGFIERYAALGAGGQVVKNIYAGSLGTTTADLIASFDYSNIRYSVPVINKNHSAIWTGALNSGTATLNFTASSTGNVDGVNTISATASGGGLGVSAYTFRISGVNTHSMTSAGAFSATGTGTFGSNVTVGTTTPNSRPLYVTHATLPLFGMAVNGVEKMLMGMSSGAGIIIAGSVANDFVLRNPQKILLSADDGVTAHFSISSNGNMGIGIATGLAKLHVAGTSYSATQAIITTSTATAAGTTTLTVASNGIQIFTGSTTQTVTLPVVTTLLNGFMFRVVNLSSGVVTVQTSGANSIKALAANSFIDLWVKDTTGGTGTASWNWFYNSAINN